MATADRSTRLRGVPEIWRWHRGSLRAYVLSADEQYVESQMSLNLPMLCVKDLEPFLEFQSADEESAWIAQFRHWVRERFAKAE